MKKSGFVSISGQPNVGKSTLLNGLLKEKLAIISKKPETTRDNIRGILTQGNCQIIFTDNPGFHKPHDLLGKVMLSRAQSSLLESDIILLMTEKRLAMNEEDRNIISRLSRATCGERSRTKSRGLPKPKNNRTVIFIINKVDQVKDKKVLLPIINEAKELYPFDEIMPMCALKRPDLDKVLEIIKSYLPKGPFLYPKDEVTDKSERFMIQELIREKILSETGAEIPYSVAVVVDDMAEDEKKKLLKIYATIFVERESQKPIIVGKNGAKLKQIGRLARLEIEKFLARHVYLDLWVKVYEKWKKDPQALEEIGYSE